MPQDISGYDVGALLYCPANAHHTVAQAVAAERLPRPLSPALGLGAASFGKWGIVPVLWVIAALAVANFFVKGGQETLHTKKMGLIDGAKQALGVGIACAIVGVIIGVLTLAGAAGGLSSCTALGSRIFAYRHQSRWRRSRRT